MSEPSVEPSSTSTISNRSPSRARAHARVELLDRGLLVVDRGDDAEQLERPPSRRPDRPARRRPDARARSRSSQPDRAGVGDVAEQLEAARSRRSARSRPATGGGRVRARPAASATPRTRAASDAALTSSAIAAQPAPAIQSSCPRHTRQSSQASTRTNSAPRVSADRMADRAEPEPSPDEAGDALPVALALDRSRSLAGRCSGPAPNRATVKMRQHGRGHAGADQEVTATRAREAAPARRRARTAAAVRRSP